MIDARAPMHYIGGMARARILVASAAIVTLASSAVSAQTSPSAGSRTEASQVGSHDAESRVRLTLPGAPTQRDEAGASSSDSQLTRRSEARAEDQQLARRREGRDAAPQLTTERAPVTPGTQLYRGSATAQAPTPLSRPSEGRSAPLVRLGGSDRCDPQTGDAAGRAACARVIETRSAEFERADPLILSPEQRLLVDQRSREGSSSVQSTAQRIGRNEIDANTLDAQSIASLTLRTPDTSAPPTREAEVTDTQAQINEIVQAIVSGVNGGMPAAPIVPR